MFTHCKKIEVDSREVVEVVRLLGRLGLRFGISDEYCKVDDLDPKHKVWFRKFSIYGRKRQLKRFSAARNIIRINYL